MKVLIASAALMIALGGIAVAADPRVSQAQARVREELKDADSAHFRNVAVRGSRVCGEVNAKNSFGGYGGYTPFVYYVATREALVFNGWSGRDLDVLCPQKDP